MGAQGVEQAGRRLLLGRLQPALHKEAAPAHAAADQRLQVPLAALDRSE
jgi:hypothetical protein